MKALSVRAPWWWAILHGKPVENRDWSTNFQGRIYLHASKFWKQSEIDEDLEEIFEMAQCDQLEMPTPDLGKMKGVGGCLVGSVEIVCCVKDHLSAFFVGDYGFVLRDPVTFATPIPFKGALGFFNVPDNIERYSEPSSFFGVDLAAREEPRLPLFEGIE